MPRLAVVVWCATTLAFPGAALSAAMPLDGLAPDQWALDRIQAPVTWGPPPPRPVTVAVLDTGVDVRHPDLASTVWRNPGEIPGNGVDDDANGYPDDVHGWDFVNGDASVFDDPVADAHGTYVAGVLAAAHDGVGVVGVAPAARVMSLKFMGPLGGGGLKDAVAALKYARSMGARVVNASFAGPFTPELCAAVQEAAAAGVVVVAAAGNEARNVDAAPVAPASCPEPSLIAVAASDRGDGLAAFSNHGAATVDVAAPGEDVLTTAPGGTWDVHSGSSLAAPHVAGVAATLLSHRPELTPLQVKEAILAGAARSPALAGFVAQGARLDAAGALGVPASPVALLAQAGRVAAVPATLAPAAHGAPRVVRAWPGGPARVPAAGARLRLRFRVTGDTRVVVTVRGPADGRVLTRVAREAAQGDNTLLVSLRGAGGRAATPGRYVVGVRAAMTAVERAVAVVVTP